MIHFALDWLDYISLFFIIFMGIPHGAIDGAISVTFGFTKSFHLQVRFIITYFLIAILVVVLWYFLPVFSLILFLLVSMFHFGCGDLNWKNNNLYYISGYAHGGLIVVGIIFYNKSVYFDYLVSHLIIIIFTMNIHKFIFKETNPCQK